MLLRGDTENWWSWRVCGRGDFSRVVALWLRWWCGFAVGASRWFVVVRGRKKREGLIRAMKERGVVGGFYKNVSST